MITLDLDNQQRSNVLARFEKYVMPIPESGCMVWTGMLDINGYGILRLPGRLRKQVKAHRLSYYLAHGSLPDDLILDHLCRVRCCINPHHLEPVTHLVNIHRGVAPSIIASIANQCTHGHVFTEVNTLIGKSDGKRYCRECCRLKKAARRQKIKEHKRVNGIGRKRPAARTHCKRGHELTPDNTLIHPTQRYCRSCYEARQERMRKA